MTLAPNDLRSIPQVLCRHPWTAESRTSSLHDPAPNDASICTNGGRRRRAYAHLFMSDTVSTDRADELLAGLNPPQRDAVLHGEGPLLIPPGGRTGKARDLTPRHAHLHRTGQARAS